MYEYNFVLTFDSDDLAYEHDTTYGYSYSSCHRAICYTVYLTIDDTFTCLKHVCYDDKCKTIFPLYFFTDRKMETDEFILFNKMYFVSKIFP